LKRKIEYPVFKIRVTDHGELDRFVGRICNIIEDFGVYQEIGAT